MNAEPGSGHDRVGAAAAGVFTERPIGQRRARPHTISGYRDTFRLLLSFATARTGKTPSALDIADLDAPLISAFLDHLERERGNQAQTRNNRLAAIHSLFSYSALRHPEHAATIQRVLAIPTKRCDRNLVTYLTQAEVDALQPPRTGLPGPAAVTTPCSPWPRKPGCGSPR